MKQTRMRIIIEGRLQGSNFRYQTQQEAQKLEVIGFVRNLADGRIEIELQGSEGNVAEMFAWCQQGPLSTLIKKILYRYDEPVDRYSDFSAR